MKASRSSTECGNQKHLLVHLANALFNRCEKWDLETREDLFKSRVSTIGDRMENRVPTLHFCASSRSDQKHLPGYFHSCVRAIIELSVATFSTLYQKKKNESRGWYTTILGFLSCQGNAFSKLGEGSYSYPSLLACSVDRTIKQIRLLWGGWSSFYGLHIPGLGHVDQKH